MSASTRQAPEIPVLESARLRLRAHRIQDFANSCALWSDPAVTHFTSRRAFTPEEIWTRLLRYAGHWSMLGYGYWVIEEKSTGAFLGEIGFADYHRAIEPPLAYPESGWALASSAHGKGFATEAINTILAWADAHFAFDRTACIIDPENAASVRVAEKCGYKFVKNVQYKEDLVGLYERRKP